jgi:hypothetical protein
MEGLEGAQINNLWNINTDSMTITSTSATMINSNVGLISIRAGTILFNTGTSNVAIASTANIRIDANELLFTYLSPHYTVVISLPAVILSPLNNSIDADYIRDISLNVSTGAQLSLSCKNMVNLNSSTVYTINNAGLLDASIDKIELNNTNTMFRSIGIGAVFNLTGINASHTTSLAGPPIMFTAVNGGILNFNIDTITFSPTTPGYVFANSSANVTSNVYISKLTTTGSTINAIQLTGTANSNIQICNAIVNSPILEMAALNTRSAIKCGYATGTTTLINITAAPIVFEVCGIFSTTATNAITSSINGIIGLHGVKLLSSGPCIASSGTLTLSMTPSSARFPPIGVTILPIGVFFFNAGLI